MLPTEKVFTPFLEDWCRAATRGIRKNETSSGRCIAADHRSNVSKPRPQQDWPLCPPTRSPLIQKKVTVKKKR